MAEADAQEEAGDEGEAPAKGGIVGKLATAAGLFVIILAAQIVGTLVSGIVLPPPTVKLAEPEVAEEEAEAEVEPQEELVDLDPALYQPLEPAMVVAFEQPDESVRYLQLSVQAMARKEDVIDAVKTHAPAIRNSYLLLIGEKDYRELGTLEGKEALRQEMLTEANEILRRNGSEPAVEEIFFTAFVAQ